MKLIGDMHTHTIYSHGKGTPRENIMRAIELGLDEIAVSEHACANMYYGVRGKKLERLNGELDALKREFSSKIRVMKGLECNVTDFGRSDIPRDRSEYDVIILGYHKGIPPVNRFAWHILSESFGGRSTPRRNTEAIMEAADKGRADIISHPNEYLKIDVEYMAQCARELGILLEINSAHVSLSVDDLSAAARCGAKFIIGSDAHSPDRVGDFSAALAAARRAGVLDKIVNIRL